MNYQVTLAMPVYNVEKYVEKALLSALDQTFPNIEYLIIDDKGQDNSMGIVKKIISEHPRGKDVRIIDHIINQGTGATKNSAIKEAQCEYIFFMDSDDEITPNCIELLYNKIIQENTDLVIGNYIRTDCSSKKIISQTNLPNTTIRKEYALSYLDGFYVQTWNKLYKKSILKDIKCIPHHRNEDIWFSFQLTLKAQSVAVVPQITYNYIERANSIVTQKMNDFYAQQNLEILNAECNIVKETKNLPQIIYYIFFNRIIYNTSLILKSDFDTATKDKYIGLYFNIILPFKEHITRPQLQLFYYFGILNWGSISKRIRLYFITLNLLHKCKAVCKAFRPNTPCPLHKKKQQ